MIARTPTATPDAAARRRHIEAAVVAAAAALRVNRGVLAAQIAASGAHRTVLSLPWDAYQAQITAALAPAGQLYTNGADTQAPVLARLGGQPRQPDTARWVRTRTGLITGNTMQGLLAVAAVAAARRRDPWEAAGTINRVAGLNRPQAAAIAVMRAQATIPAARADAIADRTAERYLTERARTVAATEAHAALTSGAVDAWSSHLPDGTYVLRWTGGTCGVCAPMDGTTVPLEAGFDAGNPPVHPHCDCVVELDLAQPQSQAA